jgi:hypothetical protein
MIRLLIDIKGLFDSKLLLNQPTAPETVQLNIFSSLIGTAVDRLRTAKTLNEYQQFVVLTRQIIDVANQLSPKYFPTDMMTEYEKYYDSLNKTFAVIKAFVDSTQQRLAFEKFIFETVAESAKFRASTRIINGYLYGMRDNIASVRMGLMYSAYTGNTTASNGLISDQSIPNSLSWFVGKTPVKQGIIYFIDKFHNGFEQFTFADLDPQNVAVSINGYFRPNETGEWKILLGSPKIKDRRDNYSNDDLSVLWFGSNALTPTIDNYSKASSYASYRINPGTDDSPNLDAYALTIRLEQGKLYPFLFNWGQNTGGAVMCLYCAKPSDPNNFFLPGGDYLFVDRDKVATFPEDPAIYSIMN